MSSKRITLNTRNKFNKMNGRLLNTETIHVLWGKMKY